MDRQTLIRDLKNHVNGAAFINGGQLAKYLKRSRNAMPDELDSYTDFNSPVCGSTSDNTVFHNKVGYQIRHQRIQG